MSTKILAHSGQELTGWITSVGDMALASETPTQTTPATAGRTAALISLLLASTMELIDVTIVNVALPTIESELGASGSQLQ